MSRESGDNIITYNPQLPNSLLMKVKSLIIANPLCQGTPQNSSKYHNLLKKDCVIIGLD